MGASAIWHRNYWDVIVRDQKALSNIRHYIRSNPRNYEMVMNGGEPRFLGDKGLLEMPKLGFLASRGEVAPHGSLPVKAGEVILSGFLSPMEREVFKAGLKHGKPMIWVKPWGLDEASHETLVRKAVEAGRLLLFHPLLTLSRRPVRGALSGATNMCWHTAGAWSLAISIPPGCWHAFYPRLNRKKKSFICSFA